MNSNNYKPPKPSAGGKLARNVPRTPTQQPSGLVRLTRVEAAWARERAGMAIHLPGHNWLERSEQSARKVFK